MAHRDHGAREEKSIGGVLQPAKSINRVGKSAVCTVFCASDVREESFHLPSFLCRAHLQ
jgi:hypothetical protein